MKNSKEFKELYQKRADDEKVTEISNAVGITIVRRYNKNREYFKDGKKMFIKLYLEDALFVGGVNMVEEKRGTYTIFNERKYKKKFTNFFFGPEDKVQFNTKNNKILTKKGNKNIEFCLNDFIDILVKNHLSDRLFFRRKINKIKIYFLKILFWFMDSKYNWIDYYHKIQKREQTIDKTNSKENLNLDKLSIDPFFNYFRIYRKILFSFIITVTVYLIYSFLNTDSCNMRNSLCSIFKVENFSIANPILLFIFFIGLFLLHYFSLFLQGEVGYKDGFIYKLHISSLNNSFRLKIKKI